MLKHQQFQITGELPSNRVVESNIWLTGYYISRKTIIIDGNLILRNCSIWLEGACTPWPPVN